MKVALLGSRGIPAQYGGFEVFTEKLAEGLRERNWDVTVYCPRSQEYRQTTFNGVNLKFVSHPSGSIGTLVFDFLSILSAARSRPDAVVMLGYGCSPFLPILRIAGVPVIVNPDGLEWMRSKWSWLAKSYFRFAEWVVARVANQLVCDSEAIQQYFLEKHGRNTSYIAYGSDFPQDRENDISEYGVEPKSYYLVVMRLEPENRILEIVRGFIKSESSRPLLIVGQRTPYFDSKVEPLLIDRQDIRFIGTIYDRTKLYTLRRNALVYIHGHSVGGTNPSLLEAMASGNCVIASDVEFNREVLGDAGRYFTTDEDLAQIIRELESVDMEEIERVGRSGIDIIESRYRWDDIFDSYHEVLSETAGGGDAL